MPAYSDPSRIRRYLPEDLEGSLFDDSTIADQITDWSGYVDDYLSTIYQVPFKDYPDTPPLIRLATEYLVVYNLYILAGMAVSKEDGRQILWKRAHELLDKLKNKEIVLAGTDTVGGPTDHPSAINVMEGKGPLSFAEQNRNLGRPHERSWGGYTDEEL